MNTKALLVSFVGIGLYCVGHNEVMANQAEVQKPTERVWTGLRELENVSSLWNDEEKIAAENLEEQLQLDNLMMHSQENLSPKDVWDTLDPPSNNVPFRKTRSSIDRTNAKINSFIDQRRLIKKPSERKGENSFRP